MIEFLSGRFVVGRGAMSNIGDRTVDQCESVLAGVRVRLGRKPEFVHRPKQPFTTSVTGEHAACSVSAVGPGGQADDQQTDVRGAQIGDGFPPVSEVPVRFAFRGCNFGAVFDQSWATRATFDFNIESNPVRVVAR